MGAKGDTITTKRGITAILVPVGVSLDKTADLEEQIVSKWETNDIISSGTISDVVTFRRPLESFSKKCSSVAKSQPRRPTWSCAPHD
jgi:hypothetical protein